MSFQSRHYFSFFHSYKLAPCCVHTPFARACLKPQKVFFPSFLIHRVFAVVFFATAHSLGPALSLFPYALWTLASRLIFLHGCIPSSLRVSPPLPIHYPLLSKRYGTSWLSFSLLGNTGCDTGHCPSLSVQVREKIDDSTPKLTPVPRWANGHSVHFGPLGLGAIQCVLGDCHLLSGYFCSCVRRVSNACSFPVVPFDEDHR